MAAKVCSPSPLSCISPRATLAGCDAWFANPAAQASAHYCIGKNGEIHQYVDESDAAWCNGDMKNPTWPLIDAMVNPNLYTISIEHEGHTGEPWTEAMFQSDVWLIRQIAERWKIPTDDLHIIGHCHINTVDKLRCPGTGLPWQRLFVELSKTPKKEVVLTADWLSRAEEEIGKLTQPDQVKFIYDVTSGDLLDIVLLKDGKEMA